MKRCACVVLRHEARAGGHYDVMVEDPGSREERAMLLTWRAQTPPWAWRAGGVVALVRIGDHRRAYLRREGRLSEGRGWVRRVDAGWAVARWWHADGGVLRLSLRHFRGEARVVRISGDRFRLRLA